MPNPIKYSTGSETLALKKGNFYIGTGDVGKGPSDTTGYYNGVNPASGGYVIYLNREGAPGNLSYHSAANDGELITFTNNLAGQSFTSATQCLVYYATQNDKVVLNRDYEGIVTDGLVLNVDAGFTPSYPQSGYNWYSLNDTVGDEKIRNGDFFSGTTYWNLSSGGGTPTFDIIYDSEEGKDVLRIKSGGGWGMYIYNSMNSNMSTSKTYLLTIRYKNDAGNTCDIGEGFLPGDSLNTIGKWTTYQAIVMGNRNNSSFDKIHNRSTTGYLYISSVSFIEHNGLRLLNGPSFNSEGYLDFDGTNDIASFAISIDTTSSFSIEVSAKNDTMTNDGFNRQTVFCLNTGTAGYQLLDLEIWGDNAVSFNGDGSNYTGGPVGLYDNVSSTNWHVYTLSSNSGIWSWYIDGILVKTYTPTYTSTSKYFQLGARGNGYNGTGQIWNGKYMFSRIYNRALSASEVLQNYNAQKGRFGL
jgi:hypothetical protein